MSIVLDGTTGITTPGLTNTGTETIVNLTTTGNTILGDASTDTLNVGNGGLVKDASGNVGIGRSPNYQLDVYRSGTTNTTVASANDNVVNILQVSGNTAGVVGTLTSHPLVLTAGNTERMRVLTTGNILSLSGGSTTATGTGIAFPATQSASSDVNTLDDYEEGTWTPTDVSPGSVGLNNQSGYYVKIGKLVYASARFFYNANSSGVSAVVGGLPFNSNGGGFPVGYTGYTTCGTAINFRAASAVSFYVSNAATGTDITAATLSNKEIQMTFIYAAP